MITLITKTLETKFTGLSFLERYGGLARLLEGEFENGDGETVTVKRLPVSCSITEKQCFEDSLYGKLLPDEAYKSVGYLEQLRAVPVAFSSANNKVIAAEYALRFVCWLNMPKLGYSDCNGTARFESEVIKAVNQVHDVYETFFAVDGNGDWVVDENGDTIIAGGFQGYITIKSMSILPKEASQIFPESYAMKRFAFFHPYDFFAIDFVAQLQTACLPVLTLPAQSINCVTVW